MEREFVNIEKILESNKTIGNPILRYDCVSNNHWIYFFIFYIDVREIDIS